MRRMYRRSLLIVLVALTVVPLSVRSNPFFDEPRARDRTDSAAESGLEMEHGPMRSTRWGDGVIARLWADTVRSISSRQRDLNNRLGLLLRNVSESGVTASGWLGVVGFSFVFGVLHAVLPGHRKSVLISYCVADRARVVHGVALGFLFAVMHAVSAVVIVFATVSLVEVSLGSSVARVSRITQIVSSVLLVAIGAVFCYLTTREIVRHMRHKSHEHSRPGGAVCGVLHGGDSVHPTTGKWVPVVLSTGIIPCPITTSLMLFAVSVNAVYLGLVAVIALSAGLGVALAALAVLTILVKGRVLALFDRTAGHMLHAGVELAGGIMILAVGAITLMLLV